MPFSQPRESWTVDLHRTALAAIHERLGAHMVPFSGWLMPLRYTSDLAEHHAVRNRAGLFDLSHMGQIELSGPSAAAGLDRALVTLPSTMGVGRARYSLIVTEEGGILDDLIVYRLAEEEFLVVANAGNREVVLDALADRSDSTGTQVIDHTFSRAMIALQGPESEAVASTLADVDLAALPYYSVVTGTVAGVPALIARTGYTGEHGFEFMIGAEGAEAVWQALLAAGDERVEACGLAARDTLRLEASMPLYGNELTEQITPFDAGFERLVKLGHDFVGREALARTTATFELVGLAGEGRRAARAGSALFFGEQEVGRVTSGVLSPTLGHPIALALIEQGHAELGDRLQADVRGSRLPMTVVETPFYSRTR
nr:glycine cleavage system aminomethyltransferase GcvT [Actinomycetales bacterium]